MKLIAVQILTPEKEADEATMKRINIMRQSLNQSDLLMVEGIIQTIKESRKQRKSSPLRTALTTICSTTWEHPGTPWQSGWQLPVSP